MRVGRSIGHTVIVLTPREARGVEEALDAAASLDRIVRSTKLRPLVALRDAWRRRERIDEQRRRAR